jgi:hypothetical protein
MLTPSLFVVTLSGGSYDDLPSDCSIWCDLDARPNGEWLLLCSKEQADNLEKGVGGNFDGEVVSVEAWDGSAFGDGNCGSVRSFDAGILDASRTFGTVGDLPAGWQFAASQSKSSGISHWASGRKIEQVWESGQADSRLVGWRRADGALAVETNGDPVFEDADGFSDLWNPRPSTVVRA